MEGHRTTIFEPDRQEIDFWGQSYAPEDRQRLNSSPNPKIILLRRKSVDFNIIFLELNFGFYV